AAGARTSLSARARGRRLSDSPAARRGSEATPTTGGSQRSDAARSTAAVAPPGRHRPPARGAWSRAPAPPSVAHSSWYRPDARRRSASPVSLAGRRRVRRAALCRLPQNVDVEDQLPDLLLELLDLLVLERLLVLRPSPQSVLGARGEPLLPVFDFS